MSAGRRNVDVVSLADRLIAAGAAATPLETLTSTEPGFDVPSAYAVLSAIGSRRVAAGWRPLGRKMGFTNAKIWPRYGVTEPMWASMWDRTVHFVGAEGALSVGAFTGPRIEPEVVLKLRTALPAGVGSRDVLEAVEWIAAGFEIVQCPFPGWKFRPADSIAAFGLHAALAVGEPLELTPAVRDALARELGTFTLTLLRDGVEVERGVGANVLGSPALALAHLGTLLATQPDAPPLAAGEIVTTGTITDAWPVAAGQRWSSEYGTLGIRGVTLRIDA